jgi:hypothetical protein
MDKREFYVYVTPVTGGIDRELHFKCLNFGEAEGLAAPHLGDGEFISRIDQGFPTIEEMNDDDPYAKLIPGTLETPED